LHASEALQRLAEQSDGSGKFSTQVIAWSENKLKFTSGIGALGTAGLLADVSRQTIPAWMAVAIAMLPLLVFLFVRPDEMRRSVVLPFQVLASLWYLVLAVSISVMFVRRGEMTRGWPVYFIGLAIGSIPCVIILRRLVSKRSDE